jgi:hypothetical protein
MRHVLSCCRAIIILALLMTEGNMDFQSRLSCQINASQVNLDTIAELWIIRILENLDVRSPPTSSCKSFLKMNR